VLGTLSARGRGLSSRRVRGDRACPRGGRRRRVHLTTSRGRSRRGRRARCEHACARRNVGGGRVGVGRVRRGDGPLVFQRLGPDEEAGSGSMRRTRCFACSTSALSASTLNTGRTSFPIWCRRARRTSWRRSRRERFERRGSTTSGGCASGTALEGDDLAGSDRPVGELVEHGSVVPRSTRSRPAAFGPCKSRMCDTPTSRPGSAAGGRVPPRVKAPLPQAARRSIGPTRPPAARQGTLRAPPERSG
jgi:hypothetical protein